MKEKGGWKTEEFIPFIKAVGRGAKLKRDLTRDEAQEAMRLILTEQATPAQVGAFLVAQRVKGESADEVVGFTRAVRKLCQRISPQVEGLIDLGLPYDGKARTLQLAPVAALVAAAAGQPMVLHGDKEIPTKCGVGPADLLEALGVTIDLPPESAEQHIEEIGIGFLYAPRFAPAWHALTPIRRHFGLRTALNTVEKLINPANAPITVAGFFHMNYLQRMRSALQALSPQGWIVQGPGGSIECPAGRATHVLPADPEAEPFILDTAALGFDGRDDISAPADAGDHATIARQVLAHEPGRFDDPTIKSAWNTVILTAGLLLFLGNRVSNLQAGVELARETLASGAAPRRLQEWQTISKQASSPPRPYPPTAQQRQRKERKRTQYYPVYLNLVNRRCVVIGGDHHAEEKVNGLLNACAAVTLITPKLNEELEALVQAGQIKAVRREYRSGDLEDAFLVISATMDMDINAQVWEEASRRNILLNAMDDVPHCNFIAPSIVRQGDLVVSISTSGAAPALAVRLRQRLSEELGPEYGRFLELVWPLREELPRLYPEFQQRRAIWYQLVDADIIELLRQDDEAGAQARLREIVHNSAGKEEGR
jgi:anthranilate phosphoribosyltransferase